MDSAEHPVAPVEHITEITGPVAPLPPDALPLPAEVPTNRRVPAVRQLPEWLMPTIDRGMMRNHWPFTTVGLALFTGVMMLSYGWYAVPIGLAALILSFLIGERMTSRAAIRRRSATARRYGDDRA